MTCSYFMFLNTHRTAQTQHPNLSSRTHTIMSAVINANTAIKNVVNTSLSFREHLIEMMAERGLGIQSLDGLEGEELRDAQNNNLGMTELYEAIAELHETFVKKSTTSVSVAPVAVPSKSTKEPKQTKEPKEPKEPKQPKETKEPKEPKQTKEPKEPKQTKDVAAEEEAVTKAKRAPTPYALFTSSVTKANKGEAEGWDQVKVTVSLEKVTEKVAPILEHAEASKLMEMKGTEQTMSTLLKLSADLLTVATGKVHAMSLTSLLWSATGNVNPFVVAN